MLQSAHRVPLDWSFGIDIKGARKLGMRTPELTRYLGVGERVARQRIMWGSHGLLVEWAASHGCGGRYHRDRALAAWYSRTGPPLANGSHSHSGLSVTLLSRLPPSMWTSNLTDSRHLNEIFFDTL